MLLNTKKCMSMDICFARNLPAPNIINLEDYALQQQQTVNLLGIFIQADLKWDTHVTKMISKANSRLYIFRRLKHHGLPHHDLLTVYQSIVWPVMEYATPVWAGGITQQQNESIERIQKRACRIILRRDYSRYTDALDYLHLETLHNRRISLCLKFAQTMLDPLSKLHHLLPPHSSRLHHTRNNQHFVNIRCKTEHLKNSAIPFLTRLLNEHMSSV